MCVSVFHQIYVGCLLCDWPKDISGHPPRLPSSLSCQKVNQQNKALKIYPSTPHRPGRKGPAETRCACRCALFLSLLQSLLLSPQVMDMWRSVIPYGPERGGIHHSLPVPPPLPSSSLWNYPAKVS